MEAEKKTIVSVVAPNDRGSRKVVDLWQDDYGYKVENINIEDISTAYYQIPSFAKQFKEVRILFGGCAWGSLPIDTQTILHKELYGIEQNRWFHLAMARKPLIKKIAEERTLAIIHSTKDQDFLEVINTWKEREYVIKLCSVNNYTSPDDLIEMIVRSRNHVRPLFLQEAWEIYPPMVQTYILNRLAIIPEVRWIHLAKK